MLTNEENHAILINLSTIHGLAPISNVLDNFAKLHYLYTQGWLHSKWFSKLWVFSKYLTTSQLINNYKLGEIDTEQFIERLLDIFYFLNGKENAHELIIAAWNSLITWNDESTKRLNILLENKQSIYFISNTNLLNIEKIIELFNLHSAITWQLPEEQNTNEILKIAEGFFLCPSYLFKKFKAGTPGLINDVVNLLEDIRLENILLVSQYQQDLDKAKDLAIKWELADRFFIDTTPIEQLSSSLSLNNSSAAVSNIPIPINPLPNNLAMTSRHNFFISTPLADEEDTKKLSEKTLLIPSAKN